MNLTQLRYMLEIAKTKNISQAAENLYISQPSLSQQVKLLEQELDIQLFDRSNKKKLEITRAGELFLRQAQKIEKEVNELYQVMKQVKHPSDLLIGLLWTFGYTPIHQKLSAYTHAWPETELKYKIDSSKKLLECVQNRELDLSFMTCDSSELATIQSDELNFSLVSSSELTLIVHNDHPFSSLKTIPLTALHKEPVLMVSQHSFCWNELNQLFKRENILPNFIGENSQADIIIQLALDKIGMGFLAKETFMNFKGNKKDLHSIPIEPPIHREIYAVWRKDSAKIDRIQHFVNFFSS